MKITLERLERMLESHQASYNSFNNIKNGIDNGTIKKDNKDDDYFGWDGLIEDLIKDSRAAIEDLKETISFLHKVLKQK